MMTTTTKIIQVTGQYPVAFFEWITSLKNSNRAGEQDMNVPSEWPSEPCTFLSRLVSFIDDQRCRKPRRLNSVRWRLMSVHPLCGTCCFVSLLDSRVFGLLPDFWEIYAPLLLIVKLLTPNPVWRFYMRARRERQGLSANCRGSVSTCYEVWLCFVKWANDVGREHHFVTIKCCYFHCPANTAMWISCSWSLYDTATWFGCLYRPSSGRALVHRKVKRGEASP